MINVIGIDPGASGAMAIINPARALRVIRFSKLDKYQIIDAVIAETIAPCRVYLEKVGGVPGDGGNRAFAFGKGVGHLEAALYLSHVPLNEVSPQTWQKALGLGRRRPTKADRKRAHRAQAQQWFPAHKMTIEEADAILIAEYGYRIK